MLQLLVCSDIHTFTDNIRLAIMKLDRTDAVLIAGDIEAEEEELRQAVGDIPCYAVCGNNDSYLKTAYPEELLLDITSGLPAVSPKIKAVTQLEYNTYPEGGLLSILPAGLRSLPLPGFLSGLCSAKKASDITYRILITHGKEYGVPETRELARRASLWNADLVIFGHTHRFMDTLVRTGNGRECRLLNPGCLIGDPRSPSRVFANYEICSFSILKIGYDREISVQHMFL